MSIIYFGTTSKARKIGETTQQLCRRLSRIRETEKDFKVLGYVEYNGDKVTNLLIESILRYELVKLGYKHYGNDHFEKSKRTYKQFTKDCISIITKALADYNITEYKVKAWKSLHK